MIELSPLWTIIVVFTAIFVLVMAGMHVALVMAVIGVLMLVLFYPKPLFQPAADVSWSQLDNFTLTALPLFLFMGELMFHSQLGDELYKRAYVWLGGLPGGLAHATIGSCAIFAAMNGSSLATCAAIGSTAVPAMLSRGYNSRLTFGAVAAGGTLGILIPPSILMVVYGWLTDTSVGKLFMAGVVPGILLTLAFMGYVVIWSLISPSVAPTLRQASSWKDKLTSVAGMVPGLGLVFLVLGTIYLGVATPTEAAAAGAFGALILCVAERRFNWHMLQEALRQTAYTTSMYGLILGAAMIVSWNLQTLKVPMTLAQTIAASDLNPYVILGLVTLMLYILGCFLESFSMMIMLIPVLFPMMTALGFDPIWFGIFIVICTQVALITPPVAMNLYVLKGIAPNANMGDIMMGALPFVGIMTLVLLALAIWPGLATWLPSLMKI